MSTRNNVKIIVRSDGSVEKKLFRHGHRFSLEELQEGVSGYIQVVPHFHLLSYDGHTYERGTAYVNEDGGVLKTPLPPNPRASLMWGAQYSNAWTLLGDLVYVARTDEELE